MKRLYKPVICIFLAICLITASACSRGKTEVFLTSVVVEKAPYKINYYEGESFDRSGMVVIASFSDGTTKKISNYITDKTELAFGDEFVTVTYKDKSAKVAIKVSRLVLTGIEITKAPDKTEYLEGETFDKSGMIVTASFSDGENKTVEDYEVDLSTPLTASDRTWTVGYMGEWASVGIFVQKAEKIELSLALAPIKKVYVEGESFDKTGLSVKVEHDGEIFYTSNVRLPAQPLRAGDSSITIGYLGNDIEIPVTVVSGKATTFSSDYTEKQYNSMVEDVKRELGVTLTENRNHDRFDPAVQLAEPYPDGVSTVEEFIGEADYHVFYGLESFVIKTDFDYGDLEQLLDRLYFESDLLASTASVKGQKLSGGYVQVVVKYYDKELMIVPQANIAPKILENTRRASIRQKNHVFGLIDGDLGVTVYTSDQALYALTHGYKIAPAEDSPAQTIIERAKEILVSVCDDDMGEFEKMYNIYLYLLENSVYDDAGDKAVSDHCLDKKYESDMLASLFTSFYAEGPLLYGASVCYGYAKAYGLLLALEGLEVTRVVAPHKEDIGRSAFNYDPVTKQYNAFYIHSYNYVKIDGKDYLADVTFAYAGSPTVNNKKVVIYRSFCLALTKRQHAEVYSNLKGDKVSSSENYNPATFDYRKQFTYDGEHSYLCESEAQAEAYFAMMVEKARADETSEYFYLPVYVVDNYGSSSEYAAFIDGCLRRNNVPKWCRYVANAMAEGTVYYCALIDFKL